MTVRIRLKRTGRRNRPCHRLCAIDQRNARDGRVLENLGLYDPLAPRVEDQLKLKTERVQYWLSKGASLSETAVSLCKRSGIELPTKPPRKKRVRKMTEAKLKAKVVRTATLYKGKQERIVARKAAVQAAKAAKAAEAAEAKK